MKKSYSVTVTAIALGLAIYVFSGGSGSSDHPDATSIPSRASVAVSALRSSPTATPRAVLTSTPRKIPTATPRKIPTATPSAQKTYILNTSTKKFHVPSCSSVGQMKDSNKRVYTGTRQSVLNMGYSPCGRCHP